jgi:ferritin-like metal-binding protein YciE
MENVMANNKPQFADLLYQALETELGGVKVYQAALRCVLRDDLKEEWTEYLEQTQDHVRVMRDVLESLGLDPATDTPGRQVVRHIGESLVAAIDMAAGSAAPAAAQIVAAECVVLAETKDHANWELIGKLADSLGKEGTPLRGAYEQVEDEEDEHLYHTKGWSRELWIEALGLPAVLPPPEEVKDVSTAIGAARAEQSRDQML